MFLAQRFSIVVCVLLLFTLPVSAPVHAQGHLSLRRVIHLYPKELRPQTLTVQIGMPVVWHSHLAHTKYVVVTVAFLKGEWVAQATKPVEGINGFDLEGGHFVGHARQWRHGGATVCHTGRVYLNRPKIVICCGSQNSQLEFTDAQKMQIQALLRTEDKEVIRLQADIDTTTIDLHQLLDAEPVEIARVKTTLQIIATKEADLRLAHITKMQDIRQLLTPAQQQKFRMSWAHMMGRGGMMEHGGMMGQGGMRMHGKRMGRGRMRGQGRMTNPCGMQRDKPKN